MTNHELFEKLYELWFSWEEREDYAQFLYLMNFEYCSPELKPVEQQEKEYFSALVEEFKNTGEWKKLKNLK